MTLVSTMRLSMVVGILVAFSMDVAYDVFGGPGLFVAVPLFLLLGLKITKQIAMEYVGSLVMPTKEEIEDLRRAFLAMTEAEEGEEGEKKNED